MKRISTTIILFLTIAILGHGQSQIDKSTLPVNQTEWEYLEDEEFMIMYPSKWGIDTSGLLGTNLFLFSPLTDNNDQFKDNVNLLIQDLSGYNINLDQYVINSKNQVATMMTDGKIILSKREKQNDREYHKLIYTGRQDIFNLKFEQYFWVINNKSYVLTLTCEINEFGKFQEIGESILNSFKIK